MAKDEFFKNEVPDAPPEKEPSGTTDTAARSAAVDSAAAVVVAAAVEAVIMGIGATTVPAMIPKMKKNRIPKSTRRS